jgi:hypothetical protein
MELLLAVMTITRNMKTIFPRWEYHYWCDKGFHSHSLLPFQSNAPLHHAWPPPLNTSPSLTPESHASLHSLTATNAVSYSVRPHQRTNLFKTSNLTDYKMYLASFIYSNMFVFITQKEFYRVYQELACFVSMHWI